MKLKDKLSTIENYCTQLESRIVQLETELVNLKYSTPVNAGGSGNAMKSQNVVDIDTGYGYTQGNRIIWNDTELKYGVPSDITTLNSTTPTKGYHKHSHSRYSGGALDINTLELVQYAREDEDNPITSNVTLKDGTDANPHCQSFWSAAGKINVSNKELEGSTNTESKEKIGPLDLIFNPNAGTNGKWGCVAYEIDVKKCYLVERNPDGTIATYTNAKGEEMEKKSLLWNEDTTKTNIVWDGNARCWRFYAVYAPTPDEPEEE